VRDGARRSGVGRALLEELIARAAVMGKHAMIGGIDAENTASLAFHARFGFREVGRLPQVGAKFGRWIDLGCYLILFSAAASRRLIRAPLVAHATQAQL
jgi:L-amino acid N-acyltransferase YncA